MKISIPSLLTFILVDQKAFFNEKWFAFLSNCRLVGRTSDSLMAPT